MNQKDFFRQLKDELKGNPYRDRFLEELQDHAEDLEEALKVRNEFARSEMMKKYFGDPEDIKNIFLKIMHPFGKLLFNLEGFSYGIIILPFNLKAYLNITDFRNINPFSIFQLFLLCVTLFLLYFSFFERYMHLSSTSKKGLLNWVLLIILPSFLWLISGMSILII